MTDIKQNTTADKTAVSYLFDAAQALSEGNTQEQFALLNKAADLESNEARMELVNILTDSKRPEYDPQSALKHLENGVIADNPAAMMYMSRLHLHGLHVEQDNEKATEYMTDAALLGHDGARTLLAERYRHGLTLPNGEATEPDPMLAVLLLSLSAESGNHLSRIKLGDMYASGEGSIKVTTKQLCTTRSLNLTAWLQKKNCMSFTLTARLTLNKSNPSYSNFLSLKITPPAWGSWRRTGFMAQLHL